MRNSLTDSCAYKQYKTYVFPDCKQAVRIAAAQLYIGPPGQGRVSLTRRELFHASYNVRVDSAVVYSSSTAVSEALNSSATAVAERSIPELQLYRTGHPVRKGLQTQGRFRTPETVLATLTSNFSAKTPGLLLFSCQSQPGW